MWSPGVFFAPGKKYWIRVSRWGNHWRADTNYHLHDHDWYDKYIAPLQYRKTEAEAQADLDKLAGELELTPVPEPVDSWRH